ncbi:uncharacterized protein LOC108914999 [Anoplophora glabripennis]|uniref:uncharacterized protein LOC108914999 n=1 Tax=Anoplophora glabripennis TaxID=217634 RepID=UPI0008741483|nr:uncharacterized protein LOC108914999 [Anoplophora glabripennis]
MILVFRMKSLVILAFCCTAVLAVPTVYEDGVAAEKCTADVCVASDGCRCATSTNPLSSDQQSPQLISLTFDEAVTEDLYNNFWYPLLFERNNPNDEPISATFFVPHEYTDYEIVNKIYNSGFEIGVHSITKNNLQTYWRGATEGLLEQEFGGQKKILNKFANIPEEDIAGVRTPQLQLAGNYSIKAYQAAGLSYDSSWPTLPDISLYPYTLDYLSNQQCLLGSKCPNEAFKGFWILPINDLHGEQNRECSTVASCNITGTADEIAKWLTDEVDQIRNGNRAPLTLLINSYWFDFTENSYDGFTKFLDTLATYDDVYLVSQKEVLDWIKNPVPLSEFKTELPTRNAACKAYSCKLQKPDGQDRYLKACIPCPASYPWLDNPDGN